jgi:hypothetical protein
LYMTGTPELVFVDDNILSHDKKQFKHSPSLNLQRTCWRIINYELGDGDYLHH